MKCIRVAGFSLVELLIAMAIGLFLIGGVFAVYIETQSTRQTADTLARMQETGRFATMFVAEELKRAGYWGKTTYEGTLQGQNSNTPLTLTVGNDCAETGEPLWALNFGMEIEAFDNSNPYNATCLANANYASGTDVLVVRSADPQDVMPPAGSAAGNPGQLYIRSDVNWGAVYAGGTTTPPPISGFSNPEDHRYNASVFYVRPFADTVADQLPVLRRLILADGGPNPVVQNDGGEIARGVEDFQVQIGVVDGASVTFVDPDSVLIAQDKSNIVAFRFWILLRAEREEPGYTNSTRYQYADQDRTFNDGFRRMLFSRTVQARNLAEIS